MAAEIVDCLDTGQIRTAMHAAASASLDQLTLLQAVDSTNSWLSRLSPDRQHAHAVLAESQTVGRGRLQRGWHSPAGGNIYLSLGWRFREAGAGLGTLPLVVGICLCRALQQAGLEGHGIKWPNDVLVGEQKLAGILVEMQSTGDGTALAVIGIGVNVRMPQSADGNADQAIDRPWTDLASNLGESGRVPGRNLLVAKLLDELLPALERFQLQGFASFMEDWRALDCLDGRRVELDLGPGTVTGTARGVDETGGLRLEQDSGAVRILHSGEVRVRHA
jgi:BirA family biotin operon repressor/biotin-[acetyl-CoA-carboxylase] ligase